MVHEHRPGSGLPGNEYGFPAGSGEQNFSIQPPTPSRDIVHFDRPAAPLQRIFLSAALGDEAASSTGKTAASEGKEIPTGAGQSETSGQIGKETVSAAVDQRLMEHGLKAHQQIEIL